MANNAVTISITGAYTDRDIKRAIKDLESLHKQGPRTTHSMKKLATGMAIAGAAAAALAVKVGFDAVRAAMEEEKSVARLSTTLRNLGLATEQTGVEKFIDNLQFATGIADQELRPAFDRLVRSTGSVTEAQRALGIATDIAVAKGRDVTSVADILGKAYDGNTMSLGRLGVGLDKAVLKSGDMDEITRQLSALFSGQAAAAADTLAGKMTILGIGVDELQESFGKGLIDGFLNSLSGGTGDIDTATAKLREMQSTAETWGKVIGDVAAFAVNGLDKFGLGAMKVADTFNDAAALIIRAYINVADALGLMSDEQAAGARANLDAADAQREAAMRAYALKGVTDGLKTSTETGAQATSDYAGTLDDVGDGADNAKTALQRLQTQMDRMARNRSIAGQRINLAQMRQEGPGKGENLREFGLGYADQASRLAFDIAERGGKGSRRSARRVLSNAREYLGSLGLGSNFTSVNGAYLGTPGALRPMNNARLGNRVGDYEGRKSGIYIDKVIVQAENPAEAMEKTKRWVRAASLGRGPAVPVNSGSSSPRSAFGPGYGPFASSGAPF